MDQEIKAKWIAALRSGQYKQGTGALAREEKDENGNTIIVFCCLGVLCEVMGIPRDDRATVYQYGTKRDHDVGLLPRMAQRQAGLEEANPTPEGGDDICLAGLNDRGMTFEQIADLIEKGL